MNRPKKLDQKSNEFEVGFFIAKYSYELKKKVVMEYLSNKDRLQDLAIKYGIKSKRNILTWVK